MLNEVERRHAVGARAHGAGELASALASGRVLPLIEGVSFVVAVSCLSRWPTAPT